VPEHTVVAGNPAVTIREGIAGYNDVSVGDT
jgi:acetyltransferase-like isoleucine patch superfamily enzyme